MKPYGNEHSWRIDDLNSSKHRPRQHKTNICRRTRLAYRHRRRAQDKRALRAALYKEYN